MVRLMSHHKDLPARLSPSVSRALFEGSGCEGEKSQEVLNHGRILIANNCQQTMISNTVKLQKQAKGFKMGTLG